MATPSLAIARKKALTLFGPNADLVLTIGPNHKKCQLVLRWPKDRTKTVLLGWGQSWDQCLDLAAKNVITNPSLHQLIPLMEGGAIVRYARAQEDGEALARQIVSGAEESATASSPPPRPDDE